MKKSKGDLYLVPFDFTESTKDALEYAINIAHISEGRILLVSLVKHINDIKKTKEKLKWEIDHLNEDDRDIVDFKAMVGNIFDDLDKIGELTNASFIVMGTHGPTGLQKLFGSNSLKVVANSTTPFIMLQEGQKKNHISSIVMPFNFERESLQVTQVAAMLAHKYDATIHLIGFRHSDEWLLRDMKMNEGIIRKTLQKHGIKHDTHILPGNDSYEDELMAYCKKVDADLIASAYFHKGLKSYLHSFMQVLIENEEKIPVLTINTPELMTLNSRFSFITT